MSTALSSALKDGSYIKPKAQAAASDTPANPLEGGQMEGMMDMMKNQAVMMVPNMVIMQWINTFFSGFVLSE